MPNVVFTATTKELVAGQGLTLTPATDTVTLGLSGPALSTFLRQNCFDVAGSSVLISAANDRIRLSVPDGVNAQSSTFTVISSLEQFDNNNSIQVAGNLIVNVQGGPTSQNYNLQLVDAPPRGYWVYIANFPLREVSNDCALTINSYNNYPLNPGKTYLAIVGESFFLGYIPPVTSVS